jgi:hypothetical protein
VKTGEPGGFVFVSSGLNVGEALYESEAYSGILINETIVKGYTGVQRETNHVNYTLGAELINGTYGSSKNNWYWDRDTGVIVESLREDMAENSTFYYKLNTDMKLIETSCWGSIRTVSLGEQKFEVSTLSNSSIAAFQLNVTAGILSFNVTGPDGSLGFCNVSIPDNLLWGEFSVYKDGLLLVRNVDYTQTYNGTHYIFCIIYLHSSHAVEIKGTGVVPEFSSFLILPLFMIATLLAVIVYRRKHTVRQI